MTVLRSISFWTQRATALFVCGLLTALSSTFFAGCEKSADVSPALEHRVLFESGSAYTAWPAVARTADDDIVVLYTDTDEHMGPDGRIVGIRSSDEGKTWSEPFVVYDTLLDERESGITTLPEGSLIVHTWSTFHTESSYGGMGPGSYYPETIKGWVEHVNSSSYRGAAAHEGGRVALSRDGGKTWTAPVPGPDSIHGGVALADGSILVAAYRRSRNYVTLWKADSWDGPWSEVAAVRSPQPDSMRFGEPSVTQLPGGRVIMMMRVTTIPYNDSDDRCFLWATYSDDGGVTWADPYPTPLWGFPPHLLTLKDGRVVAAYGHRRPPYGQRAAVSNDGITWDASNEIVLRADAPNVDLGYPASVELKDGRIMTVYYQSHVTDTVRPPEGPPPSRHKPDIVATVWRPGENGGNRE
jgi:hypothetical protein